MATSAPASWAAMAARSPAPPPPMTRTSCSYTATRPPPGSLGSRCPCPGEWSRGIKRIRFGRRRGGARAEPRGQVEEVVGDDVEGVVGRSRPAEPPLELMQRVDRALYQAKSEGRNRVALATD